MNFVQAIILGIVEGITEFLPISSTAHLIIAANLMHIVESDFVNNFEIIIQLGAILAIVVIYAKRLWRNVEVWKRVIAAFIPTGILGFVLYHFAKQYIIGNVQIALWALSLGGVILVVFELLYKSRTAEVGDEGGIVEIEHLSYRNAIYIGCAQAIAIIPGVSRSAATIVAGRALGMSKKAVVEFSFLLAVPTMLAATLYDAYKTRATFSSSGIGLIALGFLAAFITAYFSVRYLLRFIEKHSFIGFGLYRIIVALVFIPFL